MALVIQYTYHRDQVRSLVYDMLLRAVVVLITLQPHSSRRTPFLFKSYGAAGSRAQEMLLGSFFKLVLCYVFAALMGSPTMPPPCFAMHKPPDKLRYLYELHVLPRPAPGP